MVIGLTFKVGEAVRKLRLRADLPLEEVARRANIPLPRLARIEAGRAGANIDELFALKLALNISIQELLRELRESDE